MLKISEYMEETKTDNGGLSREYNILILISEADFSEPGMGSVFFRYPNCGCVSMKNIKLSARVSASDAFRWAGVTTDEDPSSTTNISPVNIQKKRLKIFTLRLGSHLVCVGNARKNRTLSRHVEKRASLLADAWRAIVDHVVQCDTTFKKGEGLYLCISHA